MLNSINFFALKKHKRIKAALALLVLIGFLGTVAISPGIPLQPCYGSTLSSTEMTDGAVDFINTKYQSGENVDGYAAYVLDLAGEDLTADEWTTGNKTLKSRIENLADQLGDSNSLITYITSTQNTDGSFGPYANEYGTKAPLQALAAAKADTVGMAVSGQVNNSIDLAVSYFKNGYRSGSMSYAANGWSFDYRCVEALVATGEDLSVSSWVYDGRSLKEAVVASAGEAAANPAAQDAVYLAKELTVLRAVYPASADINTLADAIIAQKN
ncbi:MAG: S-layer protein, partial [Syntrophomonadaceae bacterium]|nr:S-layer protein [Syntrophomonadaceae bacterium]